MKPILDYVGQSPAFKDTPGLSGDTMALLWSMKERYNKESKFAPFFASLPESFHTGTSDFLWEKMQMPQVWQDSPPL